MATLKKSAAAKAPPRAAPKADVVPITARPVAPRKDDDLAAMCKALGHPVRLQIVRMLARHGKCYFGPIADAVAVAPSTASQHISVLKDAGIIKGWADEQRSCYCVDSARLAQLKGLIGDL